MLDAFGQARLPAATVEQRDMVAAGDGVLDLVRAGEAGPPEDQDAERLARALDRRLAGAANCGRGRVRAGQCAAERSRAGGHRGELKEIASGRTHVLLDSRSGMAGGTLRTAGSMAPGGCATPP